MKVTKELTENVSYDFLLGSANPVGLFEQPYFDVCFLQKREVLTWLIKPTYSYNVTRMFPTDEVDKEILNKVILTLVERHEGLRSVYAIVDGEVKQKVYERAHPDFRLEYIDLTGKENKFELLQQIQKEMATQIFDFLKGPLISFKLVQLSEKENVLIFSSPHANSDEYSLSIIIKEMIYMYELFKAGKEPSLEPVKFQYKDYAAWHNQLLSGEEGRRCRTYYLNKIRQSLAKENALLTGAIFPNTSRSYRQELESDIVHFTKSKDISAFKDAFGLIGKLRKKPGGLYKTYLNSESLFKLKQMGLGLNSSLFNVLFSTLGLMFKKIMGNKAPRIDIPITTRVHEEFENTVGWLMGGMIVCLDINDEQVVRDYIKYVSDTVLEAAEHRFFSHERLLSDFDMPLNTLAPLQINFIENNEQNVTDLSPFHWEEELDVYFNFACAVCEYNNAVEISVSYCKSLYSPQVVQAILEAYLEMVKSDSFNLNELVGNIQFSGK